MRKLLLFICLTTLIVGVSCKSKEKSSNNTTTTNTNAKVNSTDKKHRFIISFISIGTGIDSDAYTKMEKFLASHPNKPKFETYIWGREGESDLAFQLKEISSKDQPKFISDLKAAIGESDRVQYKENEAPKGLLKKKL